MNTKELIKRGGIAVVVWTSILLTGYFVWTNFGKVMYADEPSVGWFWGVLGTIYALIAAFALITVWEQFNSFDQAVSDEAKSIVSLWNFTDYLNDDSVTKHMESALMNYLRMVTETELESLSNGNRVTHPSGELAKIRKVIDNITFDDVRDSSAFSPIMQAYEELSTARNNRIDQSLTRIPPMINLLFTSVSVVFIFGYIIHGFNGLALYLITLGAITGIVELAYLIINDMDNPLKGIYNVGIDPLINAREYIANTLHG